MNQFAFAKSLPEEKFRLKDFKGKWVLQLQTVGGVSGATGSSFSVLGHLEFDHKGNGILNFFERALYSGPKGTPIQVRETPVNAKSTLTLIDAENGICKIQIEDLDLTNGQVETITYSLIAIKSKRKVVEMLGQSPNIPVIPNILPFGLNNLIIKRQFNN